MVKIMDVKDILKQLEVNDGTFPREAVVQAIEQRELIVPKLLGILEYAHEQPAHCQIAPPARSLLGAVPPRGQP